MPDKDRRFDAILAELRPKVTHQQQVMAAIAEVLGPEELVEIATCVCVLRGQHLGTGETVEYFDPEILDRAARVIGLLRSI